MLKIHCQSLVIVHEYPKLLVFNFHCHPIAMLTMNVNSQVHMNCFCEPQIHTYETLRTTHQRKLCLTKNPQQLAQLIPSYIHPHRPEKCPQKNIQAHIITNQPLELLHLDTAASECQSHNPPYLFCSGYPTLLEVIHFHHISVKINCKFLKNVFYKVSSEVHSFTMRELHYPYTTIS